MNEVKPVKSAEHTKDQLQAKLTVSNTDIVTMLVVKNREHINQTRLALMKERDVLITSEVQKLQKKYDAHVAKTVNKEVLKKAVEIIVLLNPKVKIDAVDALLHRGALDSKNSYFYHTVYSYYKKANCHDIRDVSFRVSGVEYYFLYDEEKHRNGIINPFGEDGIYIPVKETNLTIPINTRLKEITNQLAEIDLMTRNESKMRDLVVAQVTERAIKDSTMLSSVVADIPLLSLTGVNVPTNSEF